MNKETLTTYLNDHHAGSVGALELVDNLIEVFEGKPLAPFLRDVRAEIDADQHTLEQLIKQIGANESAVKKAGAWVMEKISRAKFKISEASEDQIGLFMALESLVLGVTGKRELWTALSAAAESIPELRHMDYARLVTRAQEQCDRINTKRLELARKAFL
ncbi:MAG: hypothetical protein H0U99_03010 [Chthoniobacterales bacterium]|nr:hypothetical protein [Chthoniobacterales bacterium]